jgi:hypothetical protein
MNNNIEVFAKDRIRIKVLSDLMNGLAEMTVYVESEGRELPYAELRAGREPAYRYNNFSVTESAEDDCVVFCPVVVGCLAVISVSVARPRAGSGMSLFRRDAATPDFEAGFGKGKNRIVLSPIDMKRYAMIFESGVSGADASARERDDALAAQNAALRGDIAMTELEIAELEAANAELAVKKSALRERLEWLSANSGDAPGELDDLRETLDVDEEIIACYETPGEDVLRLIADVRSGIAKIEDQIRIFVGKKEARVREIEERLRTGGR